MSQNQLLSVFGQRSPTTSGTAGQILVAGGTGANNYWASTLPVTAYSAQFNGSSQYLTTSSNSPLVPLNTAGATLTIEAWVYPTTLRTGNLSYTGPCIVGWGATYLNFGVYNGTPRVYWYSGSPNNLDSSITISQNAWSHIAAVWSGSGSNNLKIYVNGQLGATGTFTNIASGTGTMYIGAEGTNPATSQWPGYISNLRMTNAVVYTGAFTPPTSPLGTSQGSGTNIAAVTASQTSLLTCNGPGFTDSSINAFTITNVGTTVTSQYAPFSSFVALTKSAVQTQTILTSGTGTYYTPSGVAWLKVRMVGGGGGGGGSGTSSSAGQGGTGANTIFGSIQAYGGVGGNTNYTTTTGGLGGSGTLGGLTGIVINGGQGGTAGEYAVAYAGGGQGGSSAFGGGGSGAYNGVGAAAATNSGSGGGGAGATSSASVNAGQGGGSGGYVEAFIPNPLATYSYTVGANGAVGIAGASGLAGGTGGSGLIIVEENYTVSTAAGSYGVNYLIVAGGGGGAGGLGDSTGCGAGGAGGFLTGSVNLNSGTTYTVVVGAGGSAGANTAYNSPGGQGGSSSFAGVTTAIGGGGGQAGSSNVVGGAGGSGGGGGGTSNYAGGAGTSGQGNAGGAGSSGSPNYGAGGGGGASAAGGTGTTSTGGSGGAGSSSSITGSSLTYAGGGGGGTDRGGTAGTGGAGGGGNAGASGGGNGVSGTTNLGGGGGGASFNSNLSLAYNGGAGGSGVVILAIPVSLYSGITTGSPTLTNVGQYKVLTFLSSGSYTA